MPSSPPPSFLSRLFSRSPDRRAAVLPLYQSVVALGRDPHWYLKGGVQDDIEGRFNLIVSLLALVLLRIEAASGHAESGVALTELFVDDMDGQMRQDGVGDVVVGKRVGKMMSILGGRLTGLRESLAETDAARRDTALDEVLRRNVFQQGVEDAALAHTRATMLAFHTGLVGRGIDTVLAGDIV